MRSQIWKPTGTIEPDSGRTWQPVSWPWSTLAKESMEGRDASDESCETDSAPASCSFSELMSEDFPTPASAYLLKNLQAWM